MRMLEAALLTCLVFLFYGCAIEGTYGGNTLMSGRYVILMPDRTAKAGYYSDVIDENCVTTGVWAKAGKNPRSIEITWDSEEAAGDYPYCDWAMGRSTWIVQGKSISNEEGLTLKKQ